MPEPPIHDTAGGSVDFSDVYRTHASAVLGYLTSRAVDDPEAVMQDVFIAVLPRLGSIRGGPRGIRTLIFSIAHARVVDAARRRNARPQAMEFQPDRHDRAAASAEDIVVGPGDSTVLEALETLTDDQRDVISLRVIADLSVEQTAEVLGRSEGSVKQLQRRGLLALHELVRANEVRA